MSENTNLKTWLASYSTNLAVYSSLLAKGELDQFTAEFLEANIKELENELLSQSSRITIEELPGGAVIMR